MVDFHGDSGKQGKMFYNVFIIIHKSSFEVNKQICVFFMHRHQTCLSCQKKKKQYLTTCCVQLRYCYVLCEIRKIKVMNRWHFQESALVFFPKYMQYVCAFYIRNVNIYIPKTSCCFWVIDILPRDNRTCLYPVCCVLTYPKNQFVFFFSWSPTYLIQSQKIVEVLFNLVCSDFICPFSFQ